MSVFTADDEARLLALLEQELVLIAQISGLTEEQTGMIAQDDIDSFDRSLDGRRELIDEIDKLHQETEVLMQSYMSRAGAKDAGGRIKAVDDLVTRISDALAGCAGTNDKNIKAAQEKAEEYISRIGKLSLSRKSLGAYIQDVGNDPELFDKMT